MNCPCLWGVSGALTLLGAAPPAQQEPRALHLHALAWAALSVIYQGWHLLGKHNSTSSPLCLPCFRQPCIQTKEIKCHGIRKLKQADFFRVREIPGCFPARIKTGFQQFC